MTFLNASKATRWRGVVAAFGMVLAACGSDDSGTTTAPTTATSPATTPSPADSPAASSPTPAASPAPGASPTPSSTNSGGYAGDVTGGDAVAATVVTSAAEMTAAIETYAAAASKGGKGGVGGLRLRYTGTFDFSKITDACTQWQLPAGDIVEIKNISDVTIEGADGSAANFGIAIKGGSQNIVVRNMTIGLLPGSIDAIGIEGQSGKYPGYVWVDHNTLFSSMKECAGAGDLEFDGLTDNKAGAHHITYSYNHLHDHHKVGLIGSSDSDSSDRFITFHHNLYVNIGSRVPLQRGGYTHLYNNVYSGVSASGINVRMKGYSLIENNWFENAKNPVTSRDSDEIGWWQLKGNNIASPADFTTYGITWSASDSSNARDANDWVTTAPFPVTLPYTYTADTPACVKAQLPTKAGAGTGLAKTSCS